jgi:hypothetical protein
MKVWSLLVTALPKISVEEMVNVLGMPTIKFVGAGGNKHLAAGPGTICVYCWPGIND